jgi:hypothetical protein
LGHLGDHRSVEGFLLICPFCYVLETEGNGTRLRMEVHYLPRAFPASLLALLFRFGFGRRLPATLRAIKEVGEAKGSSPRILVQRD